MKTNHMIRFILGSILFIFMATGNNGYAQDNTAVKLSNPFDSIHVGNIKATGNLKTGAVTVSMELTSNYSENAKLYLDLGGYYSLGVQDDNGKKYKVFTNEHLIGTQDANKGFKEISSVSFGDKKMGSFTYVQQYFAYGEKKMLKVQINNFSKGSKVITDFHIKGSLSMGMRRYGDEPLILENIKIDWK